MSGKMKFVVLPIRFELFSPLLRRKTTPITHFFAPVCAGQSEHSITQFPVRTANVDVGNIGNSLCAIILAIAQAETLPTPIYSIINTKAIH